MNKEYYENTYKPIEEEVLFRPITRRLARLLKDIHFITPDLVSVLGFLIQVVVVFLIFNGNFLWAGILYFIAFYFDKLDGDLARERGIQDAYGTYFDGILDINAQILVTSILAWKINYNSFIAGLAIAGPIMFYYVQVATRLYLEKGKLKESVFKKIPGIFSFFKYGKAKDIIISSVAISFSLFDLYFITHVLIYMYAILMFLLKLYKFKGDRPIR